MSDDSPDRAADAAARAYDRARELIAEARRTGATQLDLDRADTRALTRLPDEIADLPALQVLELANTGVTDIAPLAGLTALQGLSLGNTGVTDIAPLASLTALRGLRLDITGVTDIAPLAGLTALRTLDLDKTGVTDIAPLAGLTALEMLDLANTGVVDLRPVRGLHRLVDDPVFGGLTFRGCRATAVDPRIAEIAVINDPRERAETLFAYLDGWEPPVEAAQAPEPDALVPVGLGPDGRLEIAASLPSEAERDERLKRVLHERLRSRTADLAQRAGNEFFLLSAKARSLHERLDRDFAQVDLLNVHLDIAELARLHARGREREGDPAFPPELSDALADVVQDGPGLTLDHPDVELLEERKRRHAGFSEGAQTAHDALSGTLANDADAVGDTLRRLEREVLDKGDLPEAQVMQASLHRNVLIRVGRVAQAMYSDARAITAGAVGAMLTLTPEQAGGSIALVGVQTFVDLLARSGGAFLDAAALYGPSFHTWFVGAVSSIPNLPDALRIALAQRSQKQKRLF